MNKKENYLLKSIRSPIKEFLTDAAEIGIDEIINEILNNSDLLQQIPIIKWFNLANNVRSNISLAFFIKKYSLFIGPIKKQISNEYWENQKIYKIVNDEKLLNKILEQTIITLERYQVEDKALYLGRLFVKTFKDQIFTINEYNELLFSIELMHPYLGVNCLKKFYDYKISLEDERDEEKINKIRTQGSEIDFSPLSSTGLLKLPKGGMYFGQGGAFINDLGEKFYENIIKENKN